MNKLLLLVLLSFAVHSLPAQLPSQAVILEKGIQRIRITYVPLPPKLPENWKKNDLIKKRVSQSPDTPMWSQTLHFDTLGRAVRDEFRSGQRFFHYDTLNRLIKEEVLRPDGKVREITEVRYDSNGNYHIREETQDRTFLKQYWVTAKGIVYRDSFYKAAPHSASFGTFDTLTGDAVMQSWVGGKLNYQRSYTWHYDDSGQAIGVTYEMQQHAPGKGRAPGEKVYFPIGEDGCPTLDTREGMRRLLEVCDGSYPPRKEAPVPYLLKMMNLDHLPEKSEIQETHTFLGVVYRGYYRYEYVMSE